MAKANPQTAQYLKIVDHNGQMIPRRMMDSARRDLVSALVPRGLLRQLQASYDLSRDGNPAFEEHWKLADFLSPNAANNYQVRKTLVSRSRHEIVGNNPQLHGTLKTLAADVVKRGPRLRIQDRAVKTTQADRFEDEYHRWAKVSKYRQILRKLALSKSIDGEGFKIAIVNRDWKITEGDVTLAFQWLECDHCTTNGITFPDVKTEREAIDGIEFDGNMPKRYYFLWEHPGSGSPLFLDPENAGRWIDAKFVTHWFNQDRPWNRGIPELTASIPLAALSRRFTLATVKAAELAADYAAVLESDGPPFANMDPDLEDDPFDAIPVQHGMFVTLPWGYKMNQMQPKNPTTMYDIFVGQLLQQSVRPIGVPKNVAAGYSGDASMSSAVVDQHLYISTVEEIRRLCEDEVLENDLYLFWQEAYTKGLVSNRRVPDHTWGWDAVGLKHTDPQKVALARETDVKLGARLMEDVQEEDYNRPYVVWQQKMEEQQKFFKKVGLSLDAAGDAAKEKAKQMADKDPEKDGKKKKYEAGRRKRKAKA
jgi:hypothetical protein